jgi:hypothetical protein
MRRPHLTAVPAVTTGLAAASWTALLGGATSGQVAGAAALAAVGAVWWRPAATVAGGLLVAAVTIGQLASPPRFHPAGLALAAGLLILYLVLVDARPGRRHLTAAPTVLVAAGAAAAIAMAVLAAHLPTAVWLVPVGMATAAAALVLAVGGLRPSEPPGPLDDDRPDAP